jgi:hypothetical protein
MKEVLFFITFFIMLLPGFAMLSLKDIDQEKAEKLDKAEAITLDAKTCEMANSYLSNNNQEVLKIKNNTCSITKKDKFQLKYEGIDEYRLFIGKTNFVISDDSVINNVVSVPKDQSQTQHN